jgi:hypothetical protein
VVSVDEYEKAFQSITSVLLGRKLAGYSDYEAWLTRGINGMREVPSAMSGKRTYLPLFSFYEAISQRLLTEGEAYGTAGRKHLPEEGVRGLSLANAAHALKDISITTSETTMGTCSHMKECAIYYDSSSCFRSSLVAISKCVIYSFWPRNSEYLLGCNYSFSCSFCIRCFNSESLTRCFEVSDSANCSDCYFCYNCDSLQDCMFCFNTKAKKYAIGNVQLPQEQYKRIKGLLLAKMADELEKTKSLKWGIFNIGAATSKKRVEKTG